MALVIRMREQGASNRQQFRIVVMDKRQNRDGAYLEKLGWYHPFNKEERNWTLDIERFRFWVGLGAEVSDRVLTLAKKMAPEVVGEMKAKEMAKRAKERDRRKKK
ncbi:MAG: 30S ribosomal protein S16 [Verrucomicrobiota bacterium]|nr:30S ribosomal protein S16 [Verrucomicrobiota bacterium]